MLSLLLLLSFGVLATPRVWPINEFPVIWTPPKSQPRPTQPLGSHVWGKVLNFPIDMLLLKEAEVGIESGVEIAGEAGAEAGTEDSAEVRVFQMRTSFVSSFWVLPTCDSERCRSSSVPQKEGTGSWHHVCQPDLLERCSSILQLGLAVAFVKPYLREKLYKLEGHGLSASSSIGWQSLRLRFSPSVRQLHCPLCVCSLTLS